MGKKKYIRLIIGKLMFLSHSIYAVIPGTICYPENTEFNFAGVWEYHSDTGNFYCNYMKFLSSDFVSEKGTIDIVNDPLEIMIDDSYDFIN